MRKIEVQINGEVDEEGQIVEIVRYPYRCELSEAEALEFARSVGRYASYWIRHDRKVEVVPDQPVRVQKIPESLVFDLADMLRGMVGMVEQYRDEAPIGDESVRAERLVLERFQQWEKGYMGFSTNPFSPPKEESR